MKIPHNNISTDIQQIVKSSKFPQHSQKIINLIEDVMNEIKQNLENPYELHGSNRPSRDSFGTNLPKGQRDETMLRNLLISTLYRAWELGHGVKPTINNKGYPATPFVIFVEEFFSILGIGKIEEHLEEFQSFRVDTLKKINVN